MRKVDKAGITAMPLKMVWAGEEMLKRNRIEESKNRLMLGLVAIGFILGFFFMNIGKKALLENTGILSEYTLYQMKYATVDGSAFFWYVLQKRAGAAFLLAILSTTWLGMAATWTCALWLGASFGMLMMASIFRYGLKGILLVLVGIFPQGIIYFPAALLLLQWSYEFCLVMYFPHRIPAAMAQKEEITDKSVLLRKKGIQFLLLLGVVIIGCVMESYVNPKLMQGLLKIF